MEVVNTLDIDGTQWEIQDVEARKKILELDQKTTIKITNKINTKNIKMNLIEINKEKFLQLHIEALHWSGLISEIIGTFINDFGLKTIIRCLVELDFVDHSGRGSADVDIVYDGNIRIYPLMEGNTTGMYKESYINGDAFLRMTI